MRAVLQIHRDMPPATAVFDKKRLPLLVERINMQFGVIKDTPTAHKSTYKIIDSIKF